MCACCGRRWHRANKIGDEVQEQLWAEWGRLGEWMDACADSTGLNIDYSDSDSD